MPPGDKRLDFIRFTYKPMQNHKVTRVLRHNTLPLTSGYEGIGIKRMDPFDSDVGLGNTQRST